MRRGCTPGWKPWAARASCGGLRPAYNLRFGSDTESRISKPGGSPAECDWRDRKGTEEARTPYRHRAAVAERVNARARDRSLIRLPVRGITKVKAVAHLYALTHNLMRMIRPAPEMSRMETRSSEIEPPAAEPWKPPRNRPITA